MTPARLWKTQTSSTFQIASTKASFGIRQLVRRAVFFY